MTDARLSERYAMAHRVPVSVALTAIEAADLKTALNFARLHIEDYRKAAATNPNIPFNDQFWSDVEDNWNAISVVLDLIPAGRIGIVER